MIRIIIISLIVLNLVSCKSAKDALTLKKKNSSDEFLVEKKSPLVLPPDFGKLPQPDSSSSKLKTDDNNEINIQDALSNIDLNKKTLKNSKPTSLEESILEKMK